MSATSSHYTARLTITRTDKTTETARRYGEDPLTRVGDPVELGAFTLRADDLDSLVRRVTAASALVDDTEGVAK